MIISLKVIILFLKSVSVFTSSKHPGVSADIPVWTNWINAKILDEEYNYYPRLMSETMHNMSDINLINVKNYSQILTSIYDSLLLK